MIRIEIRLTEDQLRKLRRAAREQGMSLAEVVRRCIRSPVAHAERA
ncbi:MAG: ribbon-helix-helix protein, CopG family [Gemmatimonadota bacterium]